jgi:hypothetical protein
MEREMERVLPGLYASAPEALGFGPDLVIRAFLLQRESGNVLIYRSAGLEQAVDEINDLGGIERQYLNHNHEASPVNNWVAETFGAPLHVHAADAAEAQSVADVAATFTDHHVLEDLEVIPIPGHTPGATVFLWNTGEHRILFTGDTIFFNRQNWSAAVLDEVSDRAQYLEGLERLRSLDFDVIVPSITTGDDPYYEVVESNVAKAKIDEIIDRLRQGKNG